MTKQEKIREAYGDNWYLVEKYADENGWIKSRDFSYYQNINGTSENPIINLFGGKDSQFIGTKSIYLGDGEYEKYWRHESLSGIENNRGWIKIESEDDLPKEFGMYWTIDEGKNEVSANTFGTFGKHEFSFSHGKISHYQPIEKPKPPIY